jgi:hypothetical protein
MRFAIVEDNKVINIAISDIPLAENWVASDTALMGQLYDGGIFLDAPIDVDAEWVNIRFQRNSMLMSCDWTQLPDAPVNAVAWAAYRQALRDITNQADPFAIVWPVKPS